MAWVPGIGIVHFQSSPRRRRGNVAGALENVRAEKEALTEAVSDKVHARRGKILETVCGADLQHQRDAARAREKAEKARARAEKTARIAEAKERCRRAKKDTTDSFERAILEIDERARSERDRVRAEYARPRKGPPSPERSRGARRAAETRAEQVDLEAQNVEPDLEPLFRKMARGLLTEARKMNARRRGNAKTHAYELFAEWVEEHPEDVQSFRDAQADAALRRLHGEEIPF
jgi:hypothetical protein